MKNVHLTDDQITYLIDRINETNEILFQNIRFLKAGGLNLDQLDRQERIADKEHKVALHQLIIQELGKGLSK